MKDRICLYTPPFRWMDSYRQIIDYAVESGLCAIEGFNNFEFETPDLDKAKGIAAYATSKGIRFACFSVYADLTGDDREEQIRMLKDYAQVAATLGSPYLHHTIAPDHVTPRRNMLSVFYDRGIAAVQEVYDYAQQLGVRTIFEDQGYIFNGVEGFGRFLEEVDRGVGVVIDTGNIFQVDEHPEAFIEAFAHRVCHAHIKNVAWSDKAVPGWLETLHGNYFTCGRLHDGIINLRSCVELLESTGYKGFYALEFSAGAGEKAAMDDYINQAASWLK